MNYLKTLKNFYHISQTKTFNDQLILVDRQDN